VATCYDLLLIRDGGEIADFLDRVGEYGLRKRYATTGLGCQLRALDVMGFY
jgi:hypothetical protein